MKKPNLKRIKNMIIDFSTLSDTNRYKVMSNTIFPRPIAWISTEDDGLVNLAPFSYFTPLSSNPPCVVVSIGHKEGGEKKDTLANILKHKVCTISFAHKEQISPLSKSSEALPKNKSECEVFNIETKIIEKRFPPMVKDSKIGLFCALIQTVDLKNSKTIPLILLVEKVYIDDKCIDDHLNIQTQNIGRAGREFIVDYIRV